MVFCTSKILPSHTASCVSATLPPQRPWTSGEQELCFIPLHTHCCYLAHNTGAQRWLNQQLQGKQYLNFPVLILCIRTLDTILPIILKSPWSSCCDTLRGNTVTTVFLPKMYNLTVTMEKQQTDSVQAHSIKLLSALSKNTSVIKGTELDSGSWEKYCKGKYWENMSMHYT